MTTMRFVILGEDKYSSAFNKFADKLDKTSMAAGRNEKALGRQSKAADKASGSIGGLAGHITGLGDVTGVANSKGTILTRVIAGIGVATGIAEPAVAALLGSTAALSAGVVAAGIGFGAYGLAAIGVKTQLTQLAKLQAAVTAGTKGSQAKLNAYLKTLTPALRGFATQIKATKKEYTSWSRSLEAPVLKPLSAGLKLVNPLLHDMTPFVRAASGALGVLVDKMGRGIKSTGFKQWLAGVLPLVKPSIVGLGTAVGHIVVGLGGIVKAFEPFALTMIRGLDKITGKFAAWGTTLSGHTGFKALIADWTQNWPLMKQGLESLLTILKNVGGAMTGIASPANSRLLWQVANPLLALAAKLSSNPALLRAFLYLLMIGKGGKQISGVFDSLKTGWGTFSKLIGTLTGGKINLGMQGAGDTMLTAATKMQAAADTMAGASGKAGAGGAAGGAGAEGAGGGLLSGGKLYGIGVAGGAMIAAGLIMRLRQDLKSGFKAIGNDVVTFMSDPLGAIQVAAEGWAKTLTDKFGGGVKPYFTSLGHRLSGWVGDAKTWLLKTGGDVISGLLNGAKSWWTRTAYPWMNGFGTRVSNAVGGLATSLYRHGQEAVTGLLNGVRNWWNGTASPWIHGIGPRVANSVGNLGRVLWNAGIGVIQGLLGGIRAYMAGISSWVRGNIVDPVVNAVKGFFGIHSPSTVMFGVGQHLVGGLLKGLASTSGVDIAKTIFGSLPNALGRIVEKGLISIGSLPAKALKLLGGLGSWFSGLFGGLLGLGGVSNSSGYAALKSAAAKAGWTGGQWQALYNVEMREAGFNLRAQNPTSGAYGMAQFINGPSEYYQYGGNPGTAAGQAIAMVNYVRQRYRTPAAAWAHEQAYNWYARGTKGARRGWAWIGERGPELVRMRGGEQVLNAPASRLAARDPIAGLSRSPQALAGGTVPDPSADMQMLVKIMAMLLGELRKLNATAAKAPTATGSEVGRIINGSSRSAALAR